MSVGGNMTRYNRILLVAIVMLAICFLTMSTSRFPAVAGEVGGGIANCNLSNTYLGCEWTPSADCYKPTPPMSFATSVSEYNMDVDEYNSYVREVTAYKDCIIADAKSDISDKFPALVVKGAKKKSDEIDQDVERAKDDLDESRAHLNR
jgi:hypothetical protein